MKKAIVVGATSGIGKALSRKLIEDNYKVGIIGRRTNLLEELKSGNSEHYCIKTLDITDIEKTKVKLDELVNELGGLDLLIISSGVGDINKCLDFEIEKKTIDTNVIGFTFIADWAFNIFEKQKNGHLIIISSIGGLRGSWESPSYNATKAYQMNYTEGLRQKSAKIGGNIFVTDIRPGFVNTDMAKGEGLFWIMNVDKVTRQIYSAIKKRKKIKYVTKRWNIFAFIYKRIPNIMYDKI
jgi:short-subunit dehydrogenase